MNIKYVVTMIYIINKITCPMENCHVVRCVEDHRSLGGSTISRLDNGAFVGLIYELLVFS